VVHVGGAILDARLVQEVRRRWPMVRFATGDAWVEGDVGWCRITYAFSAWTTIALLAPLETSPTCFVVTGESVPQYTARVLP